MKEVNPIVFIHIPKTAGTSFRTAASVHFGDEKICKDYGLQSEETSPIVKKWMFESPDPWIFKRSFKQNNYIFLAGHIKANRYLHILGGECAVTFLREPLQRIISEFKHFVRQNNWSKSFKEFYRAEQFINRQSKMLSGVPWAAIRFVGITEKYSLSLDFFNTLFATKLPNLQINLGKENINQIYDLTSDQEKDLRRLNADDILLYEQVSEQLEWRVKLEEEGLLYVRGMIGSITNKRLNGWAVYDESDKPVKIDLLINKKHAGEVFACEFRPFLKAIGIRRGGFVGFSYENLSLSPGDQVSAIVSGTGQPLANSPWMVPEA